MADDFQASGPPEARPTTPGVGPRRSLWRSVIYPLLVIAAIAGVIWWLEYRPGEGDTSPTGVRYGPVDLPPALTAPGLDTAAEEGALAPDFLLRTLDGGELRLSDLRGQPVVLNFWATWCSPCRKEIPQLVDAYNRLRDQGLVIVGVNMQESPSIIRPYAEDFGMEFPIVIDRDGRVGERYRLLGLPMTYFIDRDGVIRSVFTGPFVGEQQGTSVQGAIGESELSQRIAEIME